MVIEVCFGRFGQFKAIFLHFKTYLRSRFFRPRLFQSDFMSKIAISGSDFDLFKLPKHPRTITNQFQVVLDHFRAIFSLQRAIYDEKRTRFSLFKLFQITQRVNISTFSSSQSLQHRSGYVPGSSQSNFQPIWVIFESFLTILS